MRLGYRVLHRAFERRKERRRRVGRHRADDAARHQEAEGVDRVARVRHDHHIARRRDGLRHVGEAFLGAERRDHLRIGIELHAEAAPVIGGLGAQQARNALRGRIAVRARLGHRLDELVVDVLGRRQVGIAHAEIDDVGAARPRLGLQPVHFRENVGREALDAMEILDHGGTSIRRKVERRRAGWDRS